MAEQTAPSPADPRLIQWLAVQALHDRDARLVDGGGDVDDRIELAKLFIDLPVSFAARGQRGGHQTTTGMAAFIRALSDNGPGLRALLVGGPGSGKSTITSMLAQALRLPWIDAQPDALPTALQEAWGRARGALASLAATQSWPSSCRAFPLRVNLPALARWMAAPHGAGTPTLWQHLASRMSDELAAHELVADLGPDVFEALVHDAGPVLWILDGLDEVPRTAGRAAVVDVVRAAVCERTSGIAGIVVTTRPQGYEGEFDELDVMTLLPLPANLSLEYGERLVRAWAGRSGTADLPARLDKLRQEFAKPEVAVLLQTPLHTTIAAVLVAGRGTLPKSRYQLFKDYFTTVLRRELNKQIEHGVEGEDEDDGVLRALHAQAGMLLQTRAQQQPGARSSLRRRELREILAAIYEGLGYRGDERRAKVERILRFAAERLVLLIHDVEGEYAFGVRSLQEFFAAEALVEGELAVAARRMDAVVRAPHWSNVVAFVVSRCALATSQSERERALHLTVERCRALNRGDGGLEAARCLLGSHLALSMLRETERYAGPWLHDPLWEVALAAATAPAQEASAAAVERERRFERTRKMTWWDDVEIHVRLGMMAVQQSGESGARRRRQILEAASALLAQGNDDALVGWRLLNGLLIAQDQEATQLASRYAPATGAMAWAAFEAGAYVGDRVMPAWWCVFLNAHPEWFSPGRLARRFREPDLQQPVLAFDVLKALIVEPPGFSLALEGHALRFWWCSIEHRPSLPARMPEASAAWRVWGTVARFFQTPSHVTLADVLEAAAQGDVLQELHDLAENLPWPLAACIECAVARGNAFELACCARAESLGNIEDWRAAEARWSSTKSMTRDELEERLASDLPWSSDAATRGVPLAVSVGADADEAPYAIVGMWAEAHPEKAASALSLLSKTYFGAMLASLRVHQLVDEVLDDDDTSAFRSLGTMLRIDLDGAEREGWFALLDARGRRGLSVRREHVTTRELTLLRSLLARLRERPDQWGLLDPIACLVTEVSNLDPAELAAPELPADAPPRAFALHSLITLLAGRFDAAKLPALLTRLYFREDSLLVDLRATLALALRRRANRAEEATALLLAALDTQPPPTPEARDALLGALFERARRLSTPAFSTVEAWTTQYALPEPFLAGQAPPRRPPVLLSIDALRNVRLFRETPAVDVPFPRPKGDRGQWIVLVGQNGVGKTTLLRALALALADPAVASKLLDERLPLVRNGAEASVAVTLDSGRREIVIRRGERTDTIEAITTPVGELPWIVAYGVRRGNALGEKDRATELGAVGELHTLFERPAALHPAAQWLHDLDADVLREQRRTPRGPNVPPGSREAVWRSVLHALQTLLGVTAVEVEEGGAVYVTHPQLGRVPFDAMSDGYLSTAGWLIDMIARWIDRQRELDEPIGPNVLRQMCGLALIDEIDLHLHPIWQLRIIDDVRRLFPRMSFVVTTHNPLALHGARAGEIYVMRREGPHVELTQRDIRPGQDIDRVLFEQFGVEHTLDQETRNLLVKHLQMVERSVAPDDPERKRVEAQIVERFGDVGATLRDERSAADSSPLRPDEQGTLDEFLKKP